MEKDKGKKGPDYLDAELLKPAQPPKLSGFIAAQEHVVVSVDPERFLQRRRHVEHHREDGANVRQLSDKRNSQPSHKGRTR